MSKFKRLDVLNEIIRIGVIPVFYHEPVIKQGTKIAFLKHPDPAGNRVHLLWRTP